LEFGAGSFVWNENVYPFEERLKLLSPKPSIHRLGLPQWGIREWKGSLYTKDCSTQQFLHEYAKLLDTVELSSTFYTKVSDETVLNWKAAVPKNFTFLPKWPKEITHDKGLYNCLGEARAFMKQMELFEENLGTTLLQLPPPFSKEQTRALYFFIKEIPSGFPVAIEFRHSSWFENNRIYPKLEEYMIQNNISSVLSDTPDRRDVFHLSFTGPHNIIRYLSDQKKENDERRLEIWKQFLEQTDDLHGEMSFVLHCPHNEVTPELIELINPNVAERIKENLGPSQQSLL
jgi:uncharacterized protein YecE (DUF72 family)